LEYLTKKALIHNIKEFSQ